MACSHGEHAQGRRCPPQTPRGADGARNQRHGERQWIGGRAPGRVEASGVSRREAVMSPASEPMSPWHTIRWPTSARQVCQLQQRI